MFNFIVGLSVAAYHGGITYDESRAFLTAGMTPEDSVVAEVEMDRYITGPYAYAQFAVLYPIWVHMCVSVLYSRSITT